jgi:uncharacterized membrane protein YhaH (DUF805 family)
VKLLSWLFWRILLPFVLALVLTFAAILGASRGFRIGGPRSLFHVNAWDRNFYLCLFAVFLIVLFANELRTALRWGKEAEEFESELKEDEVEVGRRRGSD